MRKNNKLIAFVLYQMNENDKKLFLFDDFNKSEIDFEVYDVSPLTENQRKQNLFSNKINSLKELENVIKKNQFFIIYFHSSELPIFHKTLVKYNHKVFMRLFNDIIPSCKPLNLKSKVKLFLYNCKRIFDYPGLLKSYFKKKFFLKSSLKTVNFFSGTSEKGIEVPSFEYEKVENFKRNRFSYDSNHHVFIDQNWPYHRDNNTYDSLYDADKYFEELRNFFDYIENHTGKPIKISLHPRTLDKSGDYGNRELIKDKTLELVANSDLVFAHSSTAINMALLFNKDLILLSNKQITPIKLGIIDSYSYELNIKLLDFGNKLQVRNYKQFINKKEYKNYIQKFIISDNLKKNYKSASEIVLNFISKNSR